MLSPKSAYQMQTAAAAAAAAGIQSMSPYGMPQSMINPQQVMYSNQHHHAHLNPHQIGVGAPNPLISHQAATVAALSGYMSAAAASNPNSLLQHCYSSGSGSGAAVGAPSQTSSVVGASGGLVASGVQMARYQDAASSHQAQQVRFSLS